MPSEETYKLSKTIFAETEVCFIALPVVVTLFVYANIHDTQSQVIHRNCYNIPYLLHLINLAS